MYIEGMIRWTDGEMPRWEVLVAGKSYGKYTEVSTGEKMPDLEGIDVSHWNGVIDWSAIAASGIRFAFIKATNGTGVDPRCSHNCAGARAAGIPYGLYHVYHGPDANLQAGKFILEWNESNGQLPQLPPVLDIEPGSITEETQVSALEWLATVKEATGRDPLVYASPSTIQGVLTDPQWHTWPLWVAHYTDAPEPNLAGWPRYTFWQYTNTGSVPGILGNVDLDRFNGAEDDFLALLVLPT